MRTKTPFRRKRLISLGSSSSSSVEVKVERELQCSRCKAIFPDYLARCPECGSEEWIGLVEVNPYTRMPMETFLKACGHLLWLVGTTGFLVLLASFHTAFSGDGYIAVAKVDGDLIFLKSGQIHIEFITVFILSDIGLHQILFPFPEDRALESIFHKVVK